MSVSYLTIPIVEVRHDPPPPGSGMTREGYTKRSGAPTSLMIRLEGEKRWRRLMAWQFSNLGTLFVRVDGKPLVVREETLPQEHAHHATKKSSTQLDRDIEEVMSTKSSNKQARRIQLTQAAKRANDQIYDLVNNKYFQSIPNDQLFKIVKDAGFRFDPEEEEFILVGRDGNATWQLHDASGRAVNHMLALQWHKMDRTGRFEVVAYIS
jgi:hypothetical protein